MSECHHRPTYGGEKQCKGLSICPKCDRHCGCVCVDFRQKRPPGITARWFRCCFCHLTDYARAKAELA